MVTHNYDNPKSVEEIDISELCRSSRNYLTEEMMGKTLGSLFSTKFMFALLNVFELEERKKYSKLITKEGSPFNQALLDLFDKELTGKKGFEDFQQFLFSEKGLENLQKRISLLECIKFEEVVRLELAYETEFNKMYYDKENELDDLNQILTWNGERKNQTEVLVDASLERYKKDHRPLYTAEELILVVQEIPDYGLLQRVKLNASIGYDPTKKPEEREKALRLFYKKEGRNVRQRMKDKTRKKVDPAVIETLESIAQEERVESIKKLAAEMVSNYTASGSFDLGKALMKRNY